MEKKIKKNNCKTAQRYIDQNVASISKGVFEGDTILTLLIGLLACMTSTSCENNC